MSTFVSTAGEFVVMETVTERPAGYYTMAEWSYLTYFPLTPEARKLEFKKAVTKHLDDFAAANEYDSIVTAMGAINSVIFHEDGVKAVKAYDDTWVTAVNLEPVVVDGSMTIFEALEQLPVLSWE